jgi:circadian clock protein KaiB
VTIRRADPDGFVELVLYVNGDSAKTRAAIKTIEHAIASFSAGRATLTICDLSKQPADGVAERITMTPALVRRSPSPRTLILGQITHPDVLELLGCGGDEVT